MSEVQKRRRGKAGSSRAAMLAKRSKPPAINPAPPGPVGGQYKPLTDSQVKQIYDTSMRMLAELGMGDAPQALTDQALKCGATINDMGRLCFFTEYGRGYHRQVLQILRVSRSRS